MDKSALSPIQQAILAALEAQGDKAKYSETILAKKIRSDAKIETKKKIEKDVNDFFKAFKEEYHST